MNREQILFELAALDFNIDCVKSLPDESILSLFLHVKYLTARKTHFVDIQAAHEMVMLEGMRICPFCRASVKEMAAK